MQKSIISHSVVFPVRTVKSIVSSVVPKIFSAVDTLKFGKIIRSVEKKILNVRVEEFDLELILLRKIMRRVSVMHLRLQVIIINLEMQHM